MRHLSLAIKNIPLHDQLAANHEMMADIFRQPESSGCVLVGQDLSILHANKARAELFPAVPAGRNAELEFSDLPAGIGEQQGLSRC